MPLLQVQTLPEVTVATLTVTSLGQSNAESVGKELSALASRLGGRPLELDLGQVELLASMGLAVLITLHKLLRASGGRLALRNVRPQVYDVIAVTGLTGLFDIRQPPEGGATLSESA